ncbi:MAG: hypothetical protein ACI841_000592, partial [Planctomycetota bacterium]
AGFEAGVFVSAGAAESPPPQAVNASRALIPMK